MYCLAPFTAAVKKRLHILKYALRDGDKTVEVYNCGIPLHVWAVRLLGQYPCTKRRRVQGKKRSTLEPVFTVHGQANVSNPRDQFRLKLAKKQLTISPKTPKTSFKD